jgi:hypothetical protein
MSSVSEADFADYEILNKEMNIIKIDVKKNYATDLYLGKPLPTQAEETMEIYTRLFKRINKPGGKPWQKSLQAMITFYTKITNELIGDTTALDLHTLDGFENAPNAAAANGSNLDGFEDA